MAKRLNTSNLLTITSVTILVGVELIGAAAATGWAIGGLFDLGRNVALGVTGLCCALGVWATVNFVKNALKVEPIYD